LVRYLVGVEKHAVLNIDAMTYAASCFTVSE